MSFLDLPNPYPQPGMYDNFLFFDFKRDVIPADLKSIFYCFRNKLLFLFIYEQ